MSRRAESAGAAVARPGNAAARLDLGWPTIVVVAAGVVAAVISAALVLGMPAQPDRHFEEGGLITIASAAALALAAALATSCFLLYPGRRSSSRWFWGLLGAGFAFLAFDELAEGHEWPGRVLGNDLLGSSGPFRNWNDVIVIAYGFLALGVLVAFRRELLRWPAVAKLLGVGIAFFVVQTAIDTLTSVSYKIYPEESAKLMANTLFAFAMLTAILAMRRRRSTGTEPPRLGGGAFEAEWRGASRSTGCSSGFVNGATRTR